MVKTALKLLLVFVEYSESNAPLLIQAIASVDTKRGEERQTFALMLTLKLWETTFLFLPVNASRLQAVVERHGDPA